ncbi:MAG: hypothetical protein WCF23_17820 [Candidatus Nitrosopolaris sp.]
MRTMIEQGTLTPFTAFGHKTGQMDVRTRDGTTRNYNEIKYCQFCGKELKLIF